MASWTLSLFDMASWTLYQKQCYKSPSIIRADHNEVPASTHYSTVFYFVTKELVSGSLLHRFVDDDGEFQNSRFKLIPSVRKGSWVGRQSVGSTPCMLGKAVDCNYIHGPKYLEIDVDISSSTVANGVLGLVIGVITTLVVDMAFLVQANTPDVAREAYRSCSSFSFRTQICHRPKTRAGSIMTD
ncbi:hypothetical protein Fmac_002827 [Flemingia macrophylla]|uniref:Protein ENHANCED DISEASE RESISTANCE 2 C-terminal domain-containing protein n=1 Tax=Flemingia macrophylla TaxID=520843 RepID=A0ABD1NMF3_9FABA